MLVIAVAGLPAAPLLAARVWVTIFFLGTTDDWVVIDHLLLSRLKRELLCKSPSSSLSNIQWRDENENNASSNTFYLDILRHFQTVFTNTFHSRHTIVSKPNSLNVLMEFSCCKSCLKLQISGTAIWCGRYHSPYFLFSICDIHMFTEPQLSRTAVWSEAISQ